MKKHFLRMKNFVRKIHFILLSILVLSICGPLQAQQKARTITGTVMDSSGESLVGVTVMVKGTTNGTTSQMDGSYELKNVPVGSTLVFSFIGMVSKEVKVQNQQYVNAMLEEETVGLEDVVVVAFGTQKKESMISSIQTVRPEKLKVPSSNLTTALAGRMSGVIAYQRSGEPGQDNADFFIRGVTTFGYKKDPLILIDGIETTSQELARLQPDDIAAFSILKDATATALYGARGANGVIQVQTKEGKVGPAKVSFRVENSFSTNTQNIELADPITFMRLANEAALGRGSLASVYSQEKIENTIKGTNPYVYPATDWRKMLINDVVANQRVNMSVSGGGGVARYYIAASFANDRGNLKDSKFAGFNNNIDLKKYQLRSNINIDITKTTEAIVRLSGSFDDYVGPLDGGETLYKKIMSSNPVLFPAYYPSDAFPTAKHVLYGNAYRPGGTETTYTNPFAEQTKGYKDSSKSLMEASFELKQDLSFITKGLHFRGLMNTSRYSYFEIKRALIPYLYNIGSYDKKTNTFSVGLLNEDQNPTEYLDFVIEADEKDKENRKNIESTVYFEAALNYDQTFGKHSVGGMLVFQNRQKVIANSTSLQESLPYRNQGLSGRFTYGYDARYLAEFNFGYNGSERFDRNERYGFFPAGGLGWEISNEKFWRPLDNILPKFKLKATYGLVGNDAIGENSDRFFYLSEILMNEENKSYSFGENFSETKNGIVVKRYANPYITWEKSVKANYGLEFTLFDGINIQADYFTERRSNILLTRESIPAHLGFTDPNNIKANLGKAKAHGIDLSVDYNKYFNSGYWLQVHGNFTYAHSEFVKYEEPEYSPNRLRPGNSLQQKFGLIAERLFIDEFDVINSPKQNFGEYGPGDIKYRDVNGDGQITEDDKVPLGYPEVPEIVYGFGFSVGNARIDFSAFFQGSARSSFWIDAKHTSPFVHLTPNEWDGHKDYHKDIPLLKAYADNHWSESNRNIYALWPKLSTTVIENNTQLSSWFMRNGAFLRLKTVELGYTLPEKFTRKLGINTARIYFTGNNLLLFSGFDLWDIEMGGNGLGYPIQRVYNIGMQLNF